MSDVVLLSPSDTTSLFYDTLSLPPAIHHYFMIRYKKTKNHQKKKPDVVLLSQAIIHHYHKHTLSLPPKKRYCYHYQKRYNIIIVFLWKYGVWDMAFGNMVWVIRMGIYIIQINIPKIQCSSHVFCVICRRTSNLHEVDIL